jgi:hypothetical protein
VSRASSSGRPLRFFVVGIAAALSLLVVIPAAASASTLYVSEHPSAPGNSCAHAGFKEVQQAINEADVTPGSRIEICGGTYAEQLEIAGAMSLTGKPGSKITLPATIENSATACDQAIEAKLGGHDQDLVSICTSGLVKLSGLTLEAKWPTNTCAGGLYNTIVGGGGTLEATKDEFLDAGVEAQSKDLGCQGGVGIEVGVSGEEGSASVSKPALEVGHAILTGDTVSEYQKNGITVDGDGSNATIGGAGEKKVTITGDGPAITGQNGIQVSRGADATIDGVTISDDECSLVPQTCGHETAAQWEEDAAGILLYLPGASTTVEKTTLSDNNIGVEYISGNETRPATPQLTLTSDKVSGGYASVQINQGNVSMKSDKLVGGLIAVDVNENEFGGAFGTAGAYAPDATSSKDFLEGSEAAVQVEPSIGALTGELALSHDSVVGPVVNVGHPSFRVAG